MPAKALEDGEPVPTRTTNGIYRAWADLLRRTFQVEVLECPRCKGRMKLLAIVTRSESMARYLAALGEPTDVPARSPSHNRPDG